MVSMARPANAGLQSKILGNTRLLPNFYSLISRYDRVSNKFVVIVKIFLKIALDLSDKLVFHDRLTDCILANHNVCTPNV